VHIRHADPAADGAACAAIYAPFVADTPVSFEEVAPTDAEMNRRIADTSARYPWLVAEDDRGVAGFAYATAHRTRAAYRWAADVTVYLGQGRRRQGLGTRLYTVLLDLLVRQGVQVAVAGITLPNPASVGLHESLGFELVGVYRRIGWKAGSWYDVGWWQRELVAPGVGPPRELAGPARLGDSA
jgi:phosphinothricin acetyltransferase